MDEHDSQPCIVSKVIMNAMGILTDTLEDMQLKMHTRFSLDTTINVNRDRTAEMDVAVY